MHINAMGIRYKTEVVPGVEVLSCTDSFEFRPHIHDRYVVWLNTGGGERYSARGGSDILQPGSISVFEPGLVHANRPCEKSDRHLRSFYIDEVFFSELLEQADLRGEYYFERNPVTDRDLWMKLAFLHERIMGKPGDLDTDGRILEAFRDLLVRHGHTRGAQNGPTSGDYRIDRAVEFFHAHLDREIRLPELAETLGCTQFHLIRLFRTHKGMTPHAFLLQLRLERARRLLSRGMAAAEAAFAAGFSDQSHLTRRFKQRYGLTPSAYRAVAGPV